MNFNVFVDQASIRDRRLLADFSFVSRPLLEVGVNSEGACNRVNTVRPGADFLTSPWACLSRAFTTFILAQCTKVLGTSRGTGANYVLAQTWRQGRS